MALEHIVAVGLLSFINLKVIKNWEIWEFEKSKILLDLSTVIIVLFGVGVELLGSLDPYRHVALLVFFEVMGFIGTLIIDKVILVKRTFGNINKIRPLDI